MIIHVFLVVITTSQNANGINFLMVGILEELIRVWT